MLRRKYGLYIKNLVVSETTTTQGFTLLIFIYKLLFTMLRERPISNKRNISSNVALNVAVVEPALQGKRFSSNQQNVPIINHTSYGSLTYLNENLHAVTSTLVKPNYAYRRFRVATLQYIKATILSAPISKTNVLNSHSDIFKKTAVLNS